MTTTPRPLVTAIACLLSARNNCIEAGNRDWAETHSERMLSLVREHMPSGSGFDTGTTLADSSTPERLEFTTTFHHMDDNGAYCGWSDHKIIVRASLAYGFTLSVTGRNVRGIKDYIHDAFHSALKTCVQE